MSLTSELINPPPKNVIRAKWINLSLYLIIDFFQVLVISSMKITKSNSLIGFDISFFVDFYLTLTVLILIYILRSIVGNYNTQKNLKKPGIFQLYPQKSNTIDYDILLEPYSTKKIVQMVSEIATEMKIKNISKIYLVKTAIPNAYTIQVSSIPFLPIFNKTFVVLNSNIMKILNENEVKAVIAHELGHIKNKDSIIRKILSGPHVFLQVAYLLLYLYIITGILDALLVVLDLITAAIRILVLIIVMIVATLVSDWTISFLRKSNQMAELQADIESLKAGGYKSTVNMLIKLGQRTEVLETSKREMIWLEKRDIYRETVRTGLVLDMMSNSFDEKEIDDQKIRQAAPRVYIEKQLEILRENYFLNLEGLEGLEARIEQATIELYSQRQEILKKIRPDFDQTVNWQKFDFDRDHSLEIEEILQFIDHLQQSPLMLFQSEHNEKISERNHPSFRTRILFLTNFYKKSLA